MRNVVATLGVGQTVRSATTHVGLVLASLVNRDDGQDLVEYGLIVATIAIVVLIGIVAFGHQILPWFEHLAARITTTGT